MTLLLTLLLTAAAGGWAGAQLVCRDHNNNPVDWYVLYKLPKLETKNKFPGLSGEEKYFVREGSAYLHISSASTEGQWSLSKVPIWDSNSHPGRTLAPVYNNYGRMGLFYRFYNDHWPIERKAFDGKGHTKGVLAHERSSGFWMIHSVPKFPPAPTDEEGYSYPVSGLLNGQTFLCISFHADAERKGITELKKIIKQLQINEPYCHAWKDRTGRPTVPVEKLRPRLCRFDGYGEKPHEKVAIEIISGLRTFAKSSDNHSELYSDLLAPKLGTGLYAKTWHATLPSACDLPYQVENVRSISAAGRFNFSSNNDHSKWAVSTDEKKPWVCIGDLNRVETQKKRGGGAACLEHHSLWKNFNGTVPVSNLELCPDLVTGHRRPLAVPQRRLPAIFKSNSDPKRARKT